ncbi:response regulator [Candidatus Saccharibacteria bacterium]|nr:response regulator [Candidatus Saccharibacteria bacterium]
MNVLIIEDDQSISQMYQLKCQLTGINAVVANDGKQALEILKSFTPEVILLDILMPIMNGAEFLRIFHSQEDNKKIPVLILTNTSAEEAPSSIWGNGIAGYIVKANTTPSEVINKIKSIAKKD